MVDHLTPNPAGGASHDAYLLRDQDASEIARLRLQHEVWAGPTAEALERAAFPSGATLADLGCGPGFLALELAERVGPGGRVLGLETSPLFLEHLGREARVRGLTWLRGRRADIRDGVAPQGSLDGVVCRWVLMFVPDAERVLRHAAAALRPGGTFLGMEYLQFGQMALHPHGPAFARVFAATRDLIARGGGDADVGARLPGLLAAAGLEILHVHPTLRAGRPGDPLWKWLEAMDPNHVNLVHAGLLTPADLDAYRLERNEAARRAGTFFTAPPLLTVVARKPR